MFAAERISYSQTKAFSSIVLDYIQGHPDLQPFYTALPTVNHIKEAVRVKEQQVVDRKLLVATLENQYAAIKLNPAVQSSIEKLSHDRTFTICTAHQPNLFTGPLYFVYKILHAIKLAAHLNLEMPTYHFVPVFYMGSEDADFGELNHFTVEGKRYEWNTHQTGAVGRMKVDQSLLELIEELNGQLSIHSFGKEWIEMLRSAFKKGTTIQDATFQLVDRLFGDYGLVVLIADVPALKKTMSTIFHQDLFEHAPAKMVQKTNALLNQQYEAQAHVRDINLFYLKDAIRERIERAGEGFVVCNTDIRFSSEELTAELEQYPERFSPNVILRGIYQESILPDVAFIGGGGEIAYWLQFKELFEHYKIAFPILVLRNSFTIIEHKWEERIQKLNLAIADIFNDAEELFNEKVQHQSKLALKLNGKIEALSGLYMSIKDQASSVDPTLQVHVQALEKQAIYKLQKLENKMLRAEKRKFDDTRKQIAFLKASLFPKNGLQERVENIGYYYAKYGKGIIDAFYQHSLATEQEFTILKQVSG
jgi:bacillithiol biosynthesis cysteine-adding enzyme BshC